jgi:hypothetical protein
MKDIKDMTDEEVNHFLTLWRGECWHEFKDTWDGFVQCKLCKGVFTISCRHPNYFTISDFWKLKEYAEKEQAELWEEYLRFYTAHNIGIAYLDDRDKRLWTLAYNEVVNPRNLIEFLIENKGEWTWMECPDCVIDRLGKIHRFTSLCAVCEGTGKIKHPALVYAEELL